MTHADLVTAAAGWLAATGHVVVVTELTTCCREVPDAIGWTAGYYDKPSTVIECKASRADFLADAGKKITRLPGRERLGCRRYYLAPLGLLAVHEVPPPWGLLVAATPNELKSAGMLDLRRVRQIDCDIAVATALPAPDSERVPLCEVEFLVSAIRRLVPGTTRGVRVRVYQFEGRGEPRATLGAEIERIP